MGSGFCVIARGWRVGFVVVCGSLVLLGHGAARAATWSTVSVPAPTGPDTTLSAVSCSSARACMAVGPTSNAGPIAEQWTGKRWALKPFPSSALGDDPTDVSLQAVSCSSADACTAVGSGLFGGPVIVRWNGRQWSRQKPSPHSSVAPTSVGCGAAKECVTVGSNTDCGDSGCSKTLDEVQVWNGRKWRLERIRTLAAWWDFSVGNVACPSAHACMVVGYFERGRGCSGNSSGSCDQFPLVERWNGRRWGILTAPKLHDETLDTASCRSSTNCLVLGTGMVHRRGVKFAAFWNGSRWTVRLIPKPRGSRDFGLEAASCASAQTCVAMGFLTEPTGVQAPLSVHWNGRRWQLARVVVPQDDSQAFMGDVSCGRKGACFAVGGLVNAVGESATLVERWRGSRWSVQPSADHMIDINATLNDVSCTSDSSCLAVGGLVNINPGMPLVEQWNGSASAIQKLPADSISNSFNGVSCPTALVCVAVGSGGGGKSARFQAVVAVGRNGQWSIGPVIPPGAFDSSLTGVSCASTTDCVAVGYYQLKENSTGIPFAANWNGTNWSMQTIPIPAQPARLVDNPLGRVSCASTTSCIAVGQYTPSGSTVTKPLAAAWNGSTWKLENPALPPGAISASLGGVSCTSPSHCIAVGDFAVSTNGPGNVLAEKWNGSSWSILNTSNVPAGSGLSVVSCPSVTLCVAIGYVPGGAIAEAWNGSTWSTEQTPAVPSTPDMQTEYGLSDVSCGSATTCLAVGTLVHFIPAGGESQSPFSERRS